MKFADISGLDDIKNVLIGAVKTNHSAHALLFLGKSGSANLALALAYATFVNCENKIENDSCGTCASCVKMNKYIHPDFHFLLPTAGKIENDAEWAKLLADWRIFLNSNPYANHVDWGQSLGAENKQLGIKIEDARKIVANLTLKAFEGEYKIALIWLPEFMNTAAANMLLKTLEEPSEKTLFLLVSNDIEKLIVTIISRCQPIYVRDFEDNEIKNHLTQKLQIDESQADKATYIANGNLQTAIQYLNQESNTDNYLILFRDWMRLCFNYQANIKDLIVFSDKMQSNGREEQKNFLIAAIQYFNEALLKKYTEDKLVRLKDSDLEFINKFSSVVTDSNIEPIIQELTHAHYHIERNAIGSLIFLDLSFKLGKLLRLQ
ncbi:MAG: DNA polymerase III subunit delta [Cytophagales bacterium]